jgi:addiction module RelE/StbE family toxin
VRQLVWSTSFVRVLKKVLRRRPELRSRVEQALEQLQEDPFAPALRSHKLKGDLEGTWACTVDYEYRILFEFVLNVETQEEDVLLLTVGTHDEVY